MFSAFEFGTVLFQFFLLSAQTYPGAYQDEPLDRGVWDMDGDIIRILRVPVRVQLRDERIMRDFSVLHCHIKSA